MPDDLHVRLPTPLPPGLADEFEKKLAYVAEGLEGARYDAGTSSVTVTLAAADAARVAVIDARIREIADKLSRSYRAATPRVLAEGRGPADPYTLDPHAELLRRGELARFGRGRFALGPLLVRLVSALDREMQRMAAEMAAPPYQFPSLISAEVLDRCRYLKNFPASLNLVSHLREDLALLQNFARTVAWNGKALEYDGAAAAPPDTLLSPSVCFHWYHWLRDTALTGPRAITAKGQCFRYESSSLGGLERLWDFTMREIIFVGPPAFVLERRQACLDRAVRLLEALGLQYSVASATDPFFVDSYAVQAAFQQGFELKFELLCRLPYSGKQLAVGSVNYHQDFFGRSFGITTDDGPAHTGCIGFGLERVALAVAAQHGPDPSGWPQWLTARLDAGAHT
jgi:seryl-tRNA synthetase